MSVSVDPKKIEKLKNLESTLELLQNPESYGRLLAEVQVVLKRYEDASKRYASVDAAERYLAESRMVLESAKEQAAKVMAEVAQRKAEFETMVAVKTEEVNVSLASAVKAVAKAKATKDKTEAEAEVLVKAKADFEKMKADRYKALEAQETASDERAKVLEEKWAALKRIAG